MANNNSTDFCNDDADLLTVVQHHRIPAAIQLIKEGADVRAKNFRGETPLQLAVVNKSHVNLLTEMIPNGTLYDQLQFHGGLGSLRMAIASRDEDTVRKLAAQAAFNGVDHSLVRMLLDAGADVNSKDLIGCSPLQCAVYTGDVELVKSLIDAGADVDNQNGIGATPLHDAVVCCNEAMVLLLLSRGANVTAKTLLAQETPLHWASFVNRNNSHEGIIQQLLEFGSDVNESCFYSWTSNKSSFMNVLMYGDIDLVNLCIDVYRADLDKLTKDGSSILAFALYNKDRRVRDMALTRGAKNCTKDLINSALYHASVLCRPEYVREAIARGANVDAENRYGLTPLIAVLRGDSEDLEEHLVGRPNLAEERKRVMKLLLENSANVGREDDGENMIVEIAMGANFVTKGSSYFESRTIIEHAVMTEARTEKRVFGGGAIQRINQDPTTKAHYENCQAELMAMKKDEIEGTRVTYFSVLTEPLEVVARYARNEDVVRTFEASDFKSVYPVYAWWLKEKFDAAIGKQEMVDRASATLSTLLQFGDPSFAAFEKIVNYLSETDIYMLIESASIEN